MRKHVEIVGDKTDKYGRQLSRVVIEGKDAATSMAEAGLAWHYVRFDHDPRLDAAERGAKEAGRGLWRDPAPVPPWEWRATEKDRKRQPAGR
jgi:endonuclease YncB( thermonuclease family)